MRAMFREALGVELPAFPVMTFADAMRDYGSDKPDLRVPLKLTELTDLMKTRRLQGVPRRGRPAERPRRRAARAGRRHADAQGDRRLHAVRRDLRREGPRLHQGQRRRRRPNEEGLQSPIVKFLPEAVLREILARTGAQTGDLIFFGADREKVVNDALGALRAKVGHERGFARDRMEAAVGRRLSDVRVRRRTRRRWAARHHPFTAPKDGHEDALRDRPGATRSRRPTTSC